MADSYSKCSRHVRILVYFLERTEIIPIFLSEERKREEVFLFVTCFLCMYLTTVTILIIIVTGGLSCTDKLSHMIRIKLQNHMVILEQEGAYVGR